MSPIRIRRASGLLLVMVLVVPAVFANDLPNPFEPPQARIVVPGGLASPSDTPTLGDTTANARIGPPSGAPATDARIKPPIGAPEPTLVELLLEWLRATAGIHPQGR